MPVASIVLTIHVLCGVLWVGACASFVLAASALNRESGEWREFALKVAPRINRINLMLACAIPLTGLGNLYFAGRVLRGLKFSSRSSSAYWPSAKVVLFIAMAASVSRRRGQRKRRCIRDPENGQASTFARRDAWVRLYGIHGRR